MIDYSCERQMLSFVKVPSATTELKTTAIELLPLTLGLEGK
jgi:hypothetical protein